MIALKCAAGLLTMLVLGGCGGVTAQPSTVATDSAPGSATASASASMPTEGQVLASEPAGIKLSVADDFIILDKSKATDGSADAYFDEMAQRTGTEAKALKVLMARRNAVAIDSTGTTIEISKRKEPSMPSLDAVAKQAKGLPDVEVTEVDTGLGKGIRVSLTLIAGKKYQQFLYLQGSTSVVGVSVVSKTAARAASLFDQVVPTIRAL